MNKKTKITADIIPHEQFYKGIWLLSVKRPEWYYFMEKDNPNIIKNDHFLESVDPPLKELVSFLHCNGIRTTASCAGHHKQEKNFEKIYDALLRDKKEIKNGGLHLKDIESGKRYLYKNENYRLPWSRKEFLDKIIPYQAKGVIGIRLVDGDHRKLSLLKLCIPGFKVEEKNSIVFIYTAVSGYRNSMNKWKKITQIIKNIFKKQEQI